MTDAEFLWELDKKFEAIQSADIKGNDLLKTVYEMRKLCNKYIKDRIKMAKKPKNPLNGAD